MRIFAILCVLLATAANLFPQANPGTVGEPEIGLVFDRQARGLRLLRGIPAAARLSARFDSPDLSVAAVSAERRYAMAIEGETGDVVVVRLAGRERLAGAIAGVRRVAVSPSGSSAVVYSEAAHVAQIFTGLPESPQMRRQIDLEEAPSRLAVSDDAGVLLAVVSRNGAQLVLSLPAERDPEILLASPGIAGAEFLRGGRDAVIAEGNGAVWKARDASGPGLERIADERDGVADLTSLAISSDGSRIVAGMRSGAVTVWNLSSGVRVTVDCACDPSGLTRLRGSVFRLNDDGVVPLWLLDAEGAEARIFFVAAERDPQ